MRFKRNSNTYNAFTPEQRIMGDKAEDLGFVWDRIAYPTPAWSFSAGIHNITAFGIPISIWNRELRLWAADCAEHVLPVWEEWARVFAPEHLDTPRAAVNAAREFAWDKIGKAELVKFRHNTSDAANISPGIVVYAVNAAYFAVDYFSNDYALYAANYAASAADYHPAGGYDEEKEWQRAALAKRLDAIAPWRLK